MHLKYTRHDLTASLILRGILKREVMLLYIIIPKTPLMYRTPLCIVLIKEKTHLIRL